MSDTLSDVVSPSNFVGTDSRKNTWKLAKLKFHVVCVVRWRENMHNRAKFIFHHEHFWENITFNKIPSKRRKKFQMCGMIFNPFLTKSYHFSSNQAPYSVWLKQPNWIGLGLSNQWTNLEVFSFTSFFLSKLPADYRGLLDTCINRIPNYTCCGSRSCCQWTWVRVRMVSSITKLKNVN